MDAPRGRRARLAAPAPPRRRPRPGSRCPRGRVPAPPARRASRSSPAPPASPTPARAARAQSPGTADRTPRPIDRQATPPRAGRGAGAPSGKAKAHSYRLVQRAHSGRQTGSGAGFPFVFICSFVSLLTCLPSLPHLGPWFSPQAVPRGNGKAVNHHGAYFTFKNDPRKSPGFKINLSLRKTEIIKKIISKEKYIEPTLFVHVEDKNKINLKNHFL